MRRRTNMELVGVARFWNRTMREQGDILVDRHGIGPAADVGPAEGHLPAGLAQLPGCVVAGLLVAADD
jgi:hypothetical protein